VLFLIKIQSLLVYDSPGTCYKHVADVWDVQILSIFIYIYVYIYIHHRSESHGAVTNKQQPSALSPQPPSHSR